MSQFNCADLRNGAIRVPVIRGSAREEEFFNGHMLMQIIDDTPSVDNDLRLHYYLSQLPLSERKAKYESFGMPMGIL